MRLAVVRLMLMLALAVVSAASLCAQGSPGIELRPPTATSALSVAVRDVMIDKTFDELLQHGFPAKIHFRVEVWTEGRWVDDVVDRAAWDVIIQYDVIDHSYDVLRRTREGVSSLGSYTRYADARAASELAYSPTMALPIGKRGYVTVRVDVVTLDNTDLAEMQRWLRGEAQPAVRGKRNPGTALTNGLRTLTTRLLGGEARHYDARSKAQQF